VFPSFVNLSFHSMIPNSIRSLLTALTLLRSPMRSLSRCHKILHKLPLRRTGSPATNLDEAKAQKNPAAVLKAETEEMTVSEQTEKKLEKRRKAIQPVLEAAHESGNQEIIDILISARDERNATVQSEFSVALQCHLMD